MLRGDAGKIKLTYNNKKIRNFAKLAFITVMFIPPGGWLPNMSCLVTRLTTKTNSLFISWHLFPTATVAMGGGQGETVSFSNWEKGFFATWAVVCRGVVRVGGSRWMIAAR